MADILIRGMEMPLSKTKLIVFPSGVVQVYDSRENYLGKAKAVPLPKGHGRGIDADELIKAKSVNNIAIMIDIADAPTIVPADVTDNYIGSKSEEGETDDSKL